MERKSERELDKNDPVAPIIGMLSSLRGKYTSVELQHKAKELWVKKKD